MQLRGRAEIIFHRIPRTNQLGVFQAGNGGDEIALRGVGQGGEAGRKFLEVGGLQIERVT